MMTLTTSSRKRDRSSPEDSDYIPYFITIGSVHYRHVHQRAMRALVLVLMGTHWNHHWVMTGRDVQPIHLSANERVVQIAGTAEV
ncbi:unnamed protein product [Oppiella nova]|uniref:Uncharacterized protein n=1 Tax=Oppiella nova TaxID=334625 RepID=A0A7R9M619_9ACAR|nr:unnamed protein product [Oppiella nova]CAG2171443.1 unnamed protein product [Oppiella nova]